MRIIFQFDDWKKSIIQKEKTDNHSRRLTLPDLTLAKHARRESLAESTQKNISKYLKKIQCTVPRI